LRGKRERKEIDTEGNERERREKGCRQIEKMRERDKKER
jgi:hypothetical protein